MGPDRAATPMEHVMARKKAEPKQTKPRFMPANYLGCGSFVVTDVNGVPYAIDADRWTCRPLQYFRLKPTHAAKTKARAASG